MADESKTPINEKVQTAWTPDNIADGWRAELLDKEKHLKKRSEENERKGKAIQEARIDREKRSPEGLGKPSSNTEAPLSTIQEIGSEAIDDPRDPYVESDLDREEEERKRQEQLNFNEQAAKNEIKKTVDEIVESLTFVITQSLLNLDDISNNMPSINSYEIEPSDLVRLASLYRKYNSLLPFPDDTRQLRNRDNVRQDLNESLSPFINELNKYAEAANKFKLELQHWSENVLAELDKDTLGPVNSSLSEPTFKNTMNQLTLDIDKTKSRLAGGPYDSSPEFFNPMTLFLEASTKYKTLLERVVGIDAELATQQSALNLTQNT